MIGLLSFINPINIEIYDLIRFKKLEKYFFNKKKKTWYVNLDRLILEDDYVDLWCVHETREC